MISVHGGNHVVTVTINEPSKSYPVNVSEQMTIAEARSFAQEIAQACSYAEYYGGEDHE